MQSTIVSDFLPKPHSFVYKSVLACPDYGAKSTHRKLLGSPEVNLEDYTRCMNRRIEHQIRASWSYNYMLWNMIFRKQLNESRNVYSAGPTRGGGP